MAGLNSESGEPIDGLPEVLQSLGDIFSTPQGVRVMREWCGNPGLKLLGENATEKTVLLWFTMLWTLTELFEPRAKIRRFFVNEIDRLGYSDFTMDVEHRPFAHLGWQQAKAFVTVDANGNVRLQPA